MRHSWWRTGPPIRHVQSVPKPTGSQVLLQLGVLLAIAAIWGGGFLILLGATQPLNVAIVADVSTSAPRKPSTAITPNTPTLAPIRTATSLPANTPTLVSALTVTATVAPVSPAKTARPTDIPAAATVTPTATATLTSTTAAVSFARDVLPIFDQVCVKCHGGEKTQKSLVLKSYDDLMQGSENGPVILPGDPGNSVLIDMIVKGKMPKNGPKLLPAQIRVITDWVKAGAPNN